MGEQKYGIDFKHNKAILASQLKFNLVKPSQPAQLNSESMITTDSDYYNIYGVIAFAQEAGNDCGPTAGANIVNYYKYYQGYSDFDYNAHDTLEITMDTDPWGTLASEARDGFLEYTNIIKGYDFSASLSGYVPSLQTVKSYLYSDLPLMLLFNGADYAFWHWVTARGYDIIDINNRYIIINDPDGGYANVYVDWDTNYGYMNFVYIAD